MCQCLNNVVSLRLLHTQVAVGRYKNLYDLLTEAEEFHYLKLDIDTNLPMSCPSAATIQLREVTPKPQPQETRSSAFV